MDKRPFIAIILLLCMVFSLACTGSGSSPQPSNTSEAQSALDFQDYSSFKGFDGLSTRIVETETSIYIDYNGWLYFSDKDYKEFMPLCSRPNCRHDTEDCDAYIGTASIQYGDGYLYFMEDAGFDSETLKYPTLSRMRLDGTGHERLLTIPKLQPRDASFSAFSNRWDCFASNKYFFLRGVFYDLGDETGMPKLEIHTYAINMQTQSITELFEDLPDPNVGNGFLMLEGRGSKLYGQMLYSNYDCGSNKIVELDLETGETRELCEFEPQLRTLERVSFLKDDSLCFMDFDMQKDKQTLYMLDIETCELAEVKQDSVKNAIWRYYDGYNGLYYRVGSKNMQPDKRGFYITGEDYELIDFVAYADLPEAYMQNYSELLDIYNELYAETEKEPFFGITLSYITTDYIFGCEPGISDEAVEAYREDPTALMMNYSPTGCIPMWYLDKKDIGTGNLMWKKWEP